MALNTPPSPDKSGSIDEKPVNPVTPDRTETQDGERAATISLNWYLGPLLCSLPSSSASINSIAFPEGSEHARIHPFMVIIP